MSESIVRGSGARALSPLAHAITNHAVAACTAASMPNRRWAGKTVRPCYFVDLWSDAPCALGQHPQMPIAMLASSESAAPGFGVRCQNSCALPRCRRGCRLPTAPQELRPVVQTPRQSGVSWSSRRHAEIGTGMRRSALCAFQ